MRTIRIGFIGTNFISDQMACTLRSIPYYTMQAVYSRTEERAMAFAEEYGFPLRYTNLEDFFSCPDLDAVYIASPNSCHVEQTVAALNHGLHVICEKPLAPNTKQLKQVFDAAKKNNRVVIEAMRPAYDEAFFAIKETLPLLGKIRRVSFEFCQYSSRYDSFKAGEIKNAFNPLLSNAAIMDIGVYPIHCCVMLFGEPQSILSNSVFLENGMEGQGSLILTYPSMTAEISYSKITSSVTPSFILGENGAITIDKLSNPNKIWLLPRKESPILLTQCETSNMKYEAVSFYNMIHGRESAETYNKNTEITTKIMDTVRRQNNIIFPSDKL